MLKGSILQQLEIARRDSSRPIQFGVYYKNTLVSLCHALEDHILTDNSLPIVITAFQQGKWYLQEAERYADIAKKACQVVIMATPDTGFAEHPTSQLSNVNLVPLDPTDPVAQEWDLIILSKDITAMVICQEISADDYGPFALPASDLERKFYGLWTFEPELVQETAELAIAHVKRYQPELAEKLIVEKQAIQSTLTTPFDLGRVVSRVVDYLQTGQTNLSVPTQTRYQVLDRNLVSNEIQAFLRMAQIMDAADLQNPMAAAEVVAIAEMMGQLLDLSAWQIKRLRLAGLLHRIDSLQRVESALYPGTSTRYQEDTRLGREGEEIAYRLVSGTQVLRKMSQMQSVAQIITHQTEWWDGTGKPAGLVGDEIPLESRILALIADFQHRINQKKMSQLTREEIFVQALSECRQQQSRRFDPKLVDTLALLVFGLQQGLDLPLMKLKVNDSMWLFDSESDTDK